ncbi:MAG: ATP-grasp domain-containing protein, partial [Ktedonobacterales bacterium]
MLVTFCSDPLRRANPDPDYAHEYEAAREVGFDPVLLNFEALVDDGDAEVAIGRIATRSAPDLALYRGWMLRPSVYGRLYEALERRGARLINTPAQYKSCHYLPESYQYIEGQTPQTVWAPLHGAIDSVAIMRLLEPFGDAPLIVKDYVKSRKHEWDEACYIPSAADEQTVMRVVNRFVQLQGPDLNEGLV